MKNMTNKIMKALAAVTLLSAISAGKENHLICKSIESAFSDEEDSQVHARTKSIQGPPGKRGAIGATGERGLPGVRGLPGIPATVDYEKISEIIDRKVSEGLAEVNVNIEEMKRNLTLLQKRQRCEEELGLPFNGKCYTAPHLTSASTLTYQAAIQTCSGIGGQLAEFDNRSEQMVLQDFFRAKIPSSVVAYWIGMTYQSSESNLRFRYGKKISTNQFEWHSGYPSGSSENLAIAIRNDGEDSYDGIYNTNSHRSQGVICENPL